MSIYIKQGNREAVVEPAMFRIHHHHRHHHPLTPSTWNCIGGFSALDQTLEKSFHELYVERRTMSMSSYIRDRNLLYTSTLSRQSPTSSNITPEPPVIHLPFLHALDLHPAEVGQVWP